jgi:hypothetical protein
VAELAPPAQYTDAAGVVDFYRINGDGGGFGTTGSQFTLLQTDESDTMYRVRFVSVFGSLSGSVGNVTLTFQGLTEGVRSGPGWPNGGPLVAAADTAVPHGGDYHYSWNTEIADNYAARDADFGHIWVGGLPLMFLPKFTDFSLMMSSFDGFDADYTFQGAHMQVERFRTTGAGGGGADQRVYIVPAAAGAAAA